ncbi:hypothetical protein OSC27_06635 [Microbacterium sp. STN6]|uniref:COG4705 family protein n=1 Tax=Microbacterium sp. STN6 TaxID=2995588 RepID=UPI002260A19A|nr:hypothetical protein [Microbacterium sp. STN6]MCX7521955.1 hypothetical protein [Microbacterium sp. STN6]
MSTRELKSVSASLPTFDVSKVPAASVPFWVTKVLTTGMGETTSDFLVHRFDPVLAVLGAGIVFVIVLALQLAARRLLPWLYWAAVVMVGVFGTMVADVIHVQFGVPYAVSTAAFLTILGGIFALWYVSERTLSIHSIRSRRRELFYWATIVATFALGTAAGDMTAKTLGLGYLESGVLFAVLIALPAAAYRLRVLPATAAFWIAYVLTRPLGASFADWGAMPSSAGGLGLGPGPVSIVLGCVIVMCVAVISVQFVRRSATLS